MTTNTASVRTTNYHTNQVHYIDQTIGFAQDSATVTVGHVPVGGLIVRSYAYVTEAFNAASSDLLNIGVTGSTDALASALDISAIGLKDGSAQTASAAVANVYAASVPITVTARYIGLATAATTGVCRVVVEFVNLGRGGN